MIVSKDNYAISSLYPSTNWGVDGFIIDETTADGKDMAKKVVENFPFIDFDVDGEFILNVSVLDKPEKPPEVVGKSIELIKNEFDKWVYVYEDIPFTREEQLEQQVANLQAQIQLLFG